ncbi:MAG: hypothetical protein KGJ62_05270 [Armatimonadetes bacterium]|nr:hypothetical protein [Armatimonadota bacterium]MDE2207117.1 hypothetical protein [Armatimonadota bacterium]
MRFRLGGRGRSLNVVRIKRNVVAVASALTVFGGSFAGMPAQIAFAPILTWMLGTAEARSAATSLRAAVAGGSTFVCFALVASSWRHQPAGMHAGALAVLAGIATLFVSATAGAAAAGPAAAIPALARLKRSWYSVGMGIGLVVLLQVTHTPAADQAATRWPTLLQLLVSGVVAGAASRLSNLATPVWLYPLLLWYGHAPVSVVVVLCVGAVSAAAILPSAWQGRHGILDPHYTTPAMVGALVGGGAAGWLLQLAPPRMVTIWFCLVVMFLYGRELALFSPEPPGTRVDSN